MHFGKGGGGSNKKLPHEQLTAKGSAVINVSLTLTNFNSAVSNWPACRIDERQLGITRRFTW